MKVKDLYNKLNSINSNHKMKKGKLPLNVEVLNTPYISNEILSKIDWKYDTYLVTYKYKNKEQEIYINSNVKLGKSLINKIIKVKKFIKNDRPLYINLFLTNIRKKIDFNKNEIGPNEVNSGCTTHFLNKKDENGHIFIWRKEELDKVLIHELLHSFKLDFDTDGGAKSEGHIEAVAVLFNLMLKNKDFNKFNSQFKKQDKHFKKQMGKLLYYINDNTKIDTHIQEYYFDKSLILKDLPYFLKYLKNNNFKYNHEAYQKILNRNKKKYNTNVKPVKGKYLNMCCI